MPCTTSDVMLREKEAQAPPFAETLVGGRDARKCPFRVRVSSCPPSQSYPCQDSVYVDEEDRGETVTDWLVVFVTDGDSESVIDRVTL